LPYQDQILSATLKTLQNDQQEQHPPWLTSSKHKFETFIYATTAALNIEANPFNRGRECGDVLYLTALSVSKAHSADCDTMTGY
jgi:hypothetical protein